MMNHRPSPAGSALANAEHSRSRQPKWRPHRQDPAARGFTLIEIMVVVIIIGLLAAVIVPQVVNKVDEARVTKAKADIQALETALTEYRLDNSEYPSTDDGLKALVSQPNDPAVTHWHGPYIQQLSKDPWGRPYVYEYPGTHGQPYDLYTLGADGQPGGSDTIGNWNLTD